MAGYKVIQDIEAEDKLVGPLTLRQFIYAGIAALCLYLSFVFVSKGLSIALLILAPPMLFTGFFAFPWGRDQSTEVWALAKIRFYFKSRRRLWNQSGVKNLVNITVPKREVKHLTKDLSAPEVVNRLSALASTLDTRGWAVKNIYTFTPLNQQQQDNDRLLDINSLPLQVPAIDITADEDILDEENNPRAQQLQEMVTAASVNNKQRLMDAMQHGVVPQIPTQASLPSAAQQWFSSQRPSSASPIPPTNTLPTAASEAELSQVLKQHHQQGEATTYGHGKIIMPSGHMPATKPIPIAPQTPATLPLPPVQILAPTVSTPQPIAPPVTPQADPDTIRLASNNDLDIATIARVAKAQQGSDEVVISLRNRRSS
jgi:hypothetical protein